MTDVRLLPLTCTCGPDGDCRSLGCDPECPDCGEAVRCGHCGERLADDDRAEAVSPVGVREVVHAEPCFLELREEGWMLA